MVLGKIGTIGAVALGLYLIIAGSIVLIGLAVPPFVPAGFAIVAGILILSGR